MIRCLLYSLLLLVFSFVLLFPIPTMCTSYRIYFKSESFQNGSEVLPSQENRVEANCKVGRAVEYLPLAGSDLPAKQFRQDLRKAIKEAQKPSMTDWKTFNLTEDGEAHELTVDDTTLSDVGVGNLAVECEFKGKFSIQKEDVSGSKKVDVASSSKTEEVAIRENLMKVKVFDVEGNPRFGRNEEVKSAWEVTTWVLKPISEPLMDRLRYAWFVKQGTPEENNGNLYHVMTWNRNHDSWPSKDTLITGTAECRTPRIWHRVMKGEYKQRKLRKSEKKEEEERRGEEGSESDEGKPKRKRQSKSETSDDEDGDDGERGDQSKKGRQAKKKVKTTQAKNVASKVRKAKKGK